MTTSGNYTVSHLGLQGNILRGVQLTGLSHPDRHSLWHLAHIVGPSIWVLFLVYNLWIIKRTKHLVSSKLVWKAELKMVSNVVRNYVDKTGVGLRNLQICLLTKAPTSPWRDICLSLPVHVKVQLHIYITNLSIHYHSPMLNLKTVITWQWLSIPSKYNKDLQVSLSLKAGKYFYYWFAFSFCYKGSGWDEEIFTITITMFTSHFHYLWQLMGLGKLIILPSCLASCFVYMYYIFKLSNGIVLISCFFSNPKTGGNTLRYCFLSVTTRGNFFLNSQIIFALNA